MLTRINAISTRINGILTLKVWEKEVCLLETMPVDVLGKIAGYTRCFDAVSKLF